MHGSSKLIAAVSAGLFCCAVMAQPAVAAADPAMALRSDAASTLAAETGLPVTDTGDGGSVRLFPVTETASGASASVVSATSAATPAATEPTPAEPTAGANAQATTGGDPANDLAMAPGGLKENSWRYADGQPIDAPDTGSGAATDPEATPAAPDLGAVPLSEGLPEGATGWGIDVSQFNGDIDWARVRATGIDFAILRCGYGRGGSDYKFQQNVAGCKANGIRFGVYLCAYSWNAESGAREGKGTLDLLNAAGVTPSDLALPVYYDMENEKDGRPAGVDYDNQYAFITGGPTAFASIAQAWAQVVQQAGYRVGVYANLHWWNTYLTSNVFNGWDRWVAQYSSSNDYKGQYSFWQHTSSGSVDGISGRVDMNYEYRAGYLNVRKLDVVTVPDGTYYVNSELKDSSGIGLSGSGTTQLQGANGSDAQQFVLARQGDGSYTVAGKQSGRLLTISGDPRNGATVRLADANGSDAQRWFLRDSGAGYYLQSAMGNWVLDTNGASTSDGTAITLYEPNGSDAQRFSLASATASVTTGKAVNIVSAADGSYVMDVEGASADNGARLQLYHGNGTDAQAYTINRVGNGLYEIVSVKSGKAVEATGGETANGTSVTQYARNGTPSQHWAAFDEGSGQVSFVGSRSGRAIDVPGGDLWAGNKLQLYSPNGSPAQRWTLKETQTAADRTEQLAADHRADLPDGTYTIASARDGGQVLDAAGGSKAEQTAVQLFESNGTQAQSWRVTHDDKGYVTITNVNSGLVLDIEWGVGASGTAVWLYGNNGSKAQKWVAVKDGDSYKLVSALDGSLVLDARGGSTQNHTRAQVYSSNDTSAQRWTFEAAPKGAPAKGRTVADGVYTLAAGGKVVDVPGASTADGAGLQAYDGNGTLAQAFGVTYDEASGYYRIRNLGSGKYLDLRDGNVAAGARIQQWDGPAGENQLWSIQKDDKGGYAIASAKSWRAIGFSSDGNGAPLVAGGPVASFSLDAYHPEVGEGYYVLRSAGSGRALDVSGGSWDFGDRGLMQLWDANGSWAQLWYVRKQADDVVTIQNVNSGGYLTDYGSGKLGQEWATDAAREWKVGVDVWGITLTNAKTGLALSAQRSVYAPKNMLGAARPYVG